jgi:hypothetical protein
MNEKMKTYGMPILAALRVNWGWAMGFVGLALVASWLLARYVGLEHTFYHWDHALYPGLAADIFQIQQNKGWPAALAAVRASLNNDFSSLFTLPAVLGFQFFGGVSRTTYVVSNFIAYGCGLALVLGGVLQHVRGGHYAKNALLGLAGLLACGFVWTSAVEGYPDLGGALFLAIALLLALQSWPHVTVWRWLVMGVLLAVAILFRRHYIYPSAVFLLLVGLVQAWSSWRHRVPLWRCLLLAGVGVGAATLACTATLFWLAREFVTRLLTFHYPALYASYAESSAVLLDKDVQRVGIVGLLLAGVGYGCAWWRQPHLRPRLAVLLLLFLGWGLLWFGWVRFGGQHYLLQVLPIILPIGWVLLYDEMTRQGMAHHGRMGRRLAWALPCFLAGQSLLSFWLADTVMPDRPMLERQWFAGLLAESRSPKQRSDYDSIIGLVGYLQHNLRADDRIVVLASSPVFNQDILMTAAQARRVQLGKPNYIPLVSMPDVDRRDPLPLDAISQATILLLVTPPQYHLQPEGQQVVGSAIALLTEDADFARAWQRDETSYRLEQGAVLSIWRLQHPWSPAERAAMLEHLRQLSAGSGSHAQDWVTQRSDMRIYSVTDEHNQAFMRGHVIPAEQPTALFFIPPLSNGRYQISAMVQSMCALQMQLRLLDGEGNTVQLLQPVLDKQDRFVASFAPVAVMPDSLHLQLELQSSTPNAQASCPFAISNLLVLKKE